MGPETKRELRKYAHRLIMTTTAAGAEMQFDDLAIVFIKTALADYWKVEEGDGAEFLRQAANILADASEWIANATGPVPAEWDSDGDAEAAA
jgi:hypothetical protein